MTVETATKISELVATNPAGSDPKSEGDNHLRLIKGVLQDVFDDSGTTLKTTLPIESPDGAVFGDITAGDITAGDITAGDVTASGTISGDSLDVDSALVAGKPVMVKTARARNAVTNPSAQVSQQMGITGVTTSNAYPVDEWLLDIAGIVGAAGKLLLPTPSPEGTMTSVGIVATVAKPTLAAGDFLQLITPIEGINIADYAWGKPQAKAVVLRFCACGPIGTYGLALGNHDGTRSYCASFTLAAADVPQVFEIAIPGDTTGTWNTGKVLALQIRFTYASGSTYIGVPGWQAGVKISPPGCANGAAIANRNMLITDVGLYLDPDNSGIAPPFVTPRFEDTLARCLRYYEKSYDQDTVPGSAVLNGARELISLNVGDFFDAGFTAFKVMKRTPPVMAGWSTDGTPGVLRNLSASINQGNLSIGHASDRSFTARCGNNQMTTQNLFGFHWTASARLI